MRIPVGNVWLISLLVVTFTTAVLAHPGGHGNALPGETRVWTNRISGEHFSGTYLLTRDNNVYLESTQGRSVVLPLNELSDSDRQYAAQRSSQVRQLNVQHAPHGLPTRSSRSLRVFTLAGVLFGVMWFACRRGLHFQRVAVGWLLLTVTLISFGWRQHAQSTKRPAMAAAFDKYSPKIKTRWDENYLYVESDGLPDHPLMIGIRAWQQQVPLPQPYTGANAWPIPLKPVLAEKPISAKTALYRGAIALAVNGVPIFNALNNRGEDALLFGELDEWGGHCGRADDYHYHAAPLHIQQKVGTAQPIGYALDGFPLYGLKEPDGKPARPLDELNGHADKADTYHYHSTKNFPYINGGLRGVVTVRDDEISPQAHAAPVRPYLQPLRGATITEFKTLAPNQWQLKYQLQGKTHEVNYSLSADGKADFTFIDGNGNRVMEHYTRRAGNRRGGPPPNEQRRP